jgi:trimethylamine--corrinoid protein Co-methyltransferase
MPDARRNRRSRRSRGQSDSQSSAPAAPAYLTRNIPLYEILDEQGLQIVENNADTLLEEIGIDFCFWSFFDFGRL